MATKSFIKTIGEKGLLADYNTEGKKLQTELTAGKGISISNDNVIDNTNNIVDTKYSFTNKSGTENDLILIATVPYKMMSVTHIISNDSQTSYAWGLDITIETTNNKLVYVTGTTRTKQPINKKPPIVVGSYNNEIVLCIRHNLVSSVLHEIKTTAVYTKYCNLPKGYQLLSASDVDESRTTYALNWKQFIDAESTARANADTALKEAIDGKMDSQSAGNVSEPVYIENGIAKVATNVATKDELNTKQNSLTAGNNITIDGNTISSDQVFVATYGTTKYAEIKAAYNAGKICTVFKDTHYYYIKWIEDRFIMFASSNGKDEMYYVSVGSGNTWSTYTGQLQSKLTFDDEPTAGSNNPVTSDGIKKALDSRVPVPTSTTGTQVLKCIDGVIQWVTE